MNPFQPLAYRAKEAAKALGISCRHLWQLTNDGHIPCVRIGSGKRKTVLYPKQQLEELLVVRTQKRSRHRGEPAD